MRTEYDVKNEFPVLDIVAVSVAIDEKYGYIKKHFHSNDQIPNTDRLKSHFSTNDSDAKINVSDSHYELAEEIIDYMKGLVMKAMERPLTAYENNVLQFVTSKTAGFRTMGIAASLPNVYRNKLERDKWQERELLLAYNSDYVGELYKSIDLCLVVENIKDLNTTVPSRLYCCSDSNDNIVKFFTNNKSLMVFEKGDTINVKGRVKSHEVSKFHGGKETMINYVTEFK